MRRLALGLLALAACGAGAVAQPAGPSAAERQAAAREIVAPTGVGGCVFRAVKPDVQQRIVVALMSRRGVPPELPSAVAEVSARCTGRAYSGADSGLVAASLGAFERTGIAIYFASELAIGQRRLDAAWTSASPEEKAPFVKAAASLLDAKAPASAPSPAETQPFAHRLGLEDPRQFSPVQLYYLATAYSEAGEAKLAAEGVTAPPR